MARAQTAVRNTPKRNEDFRDQEKENLKVILSCVVGVRGQWKCLCSASGWAGVTFQSQMERNAGQEVGFDLAGGRSGGRSAAWLVAR